MLMPVGEVCRLRVAVVSGQLHRQAPQADAAARGCSRARKSSGNGVLRGVEA